MKRISTAVVLLLSTLVMAPDSANSHFVKGLSVNAISPNGTVILNGRDGATHLCDPNDPDRKIAVTWLDLTEDAPGPLHIHMTGAGYSYLSPYVFEYWTLSYSPWDWNAPGQQLTGKDNLEGAFNLMIRFECMSNASFVGNPAWVGDIASNPLDVNYVYELLCTNLWTGSPDYIALTSGGITRQNIDCQRVGLSGLSGGGLTANLFLNECFRNLTLSPVIKAISTVVGGFFPLSSIGCDYSFDRSLPLFMTVACDDNLIDFDLLVEEGWENSPPPKYLYSRLGGHSSQTAPNLILGEDLARSFLNYYLLGKQIPGLDGLDDYPDRTNLRIDAQDPLLQTSYQYQSEIGTQLSGGLCKESFDLWIPPGFDWGLPDQFKNLGESPLATLPNTD